ncbi:MAG TPA: 3-oxoacyl-[acyl-carrier-protein] reductase [Candidatus Cloacimonadota bacterium]|nr:3-oxoacyl-[acyl-carrier-protein] reductase [Candidatus Cloacimonadota bacterium]
MDRLKDKVAIITGSARGIGFSIAELFAAEGATVVILDLVEEAVNEAVKKLTSQGLKADGFTGNVTRSDEMEKVFSSVVEKYRAIDILVNNAGITKDNLLLRMKEEEWDSVMAVNLRGAFLCTQKVFKVMMKQRSGVIINIASVIGLMGNAGQANYATSKGGLIAFTKSCAKEFASRNVRVNAVAPGFIQTDMTAQLSAAAVENYAKAIPLEKMGLPVDVAKACLFFASDESSYITGQTLAVDGGLTMY